MVKRYYPQVYLQFLGNRFRIHVSLIMDSYDLWKNINPKYNMLMKQSWRRVLWYDNFTLSTCAFSILNKYLLLDGTPEHRNELKLQDGENMIRWFQEIKYRNLKFFYPHLLKFYGLLMAHFWFRHLRQDFRYENHQEFIWF